MLEIEIKAEYKLYSHNRKHISSVYIVRVGNAVFLRHSSQYEYRLDVDGIYSYYKKYNEIPHVSISYSRLNKGDVSLLKHSKNFNLFG